MKNEFLIIVAGGTGSRMNSSIPKQFIEINGEAIIIKTIKQFLTYNAFIKIIICVNKHYERRLAELINSSHLEKAAIQITQGGETRFASVKNGLKCLGENTGIVGIHDAARPFVSIQTIKNCFETAAVRGNAIPCVAVNESLRRTENGFNVAVSRNAYKIIQTPQCFKISEIKDAFEQEYDSSFTDDATVLESVGKTINLVEGNIENIKITTPYDLLIAKSFERNEQ